MKTNYMLIIVAMVATIVSCSKKDDSGFISEKVVFSASMEYPQTKATLNNEGTKVLWEPGDSINLFYGKVSSKFYATATEVSANTTFTGTLGANENGTDKFMAVYPYREGNTYDGESVIVEVPDIQIARAGSFDGEAFVTIAASTDHRLQFKNLCGGVAFTVMQANVNKVVFRSGDGEYIAGKAKVAIDDNNLPVISAIIDGKSSIELRAPEGAVFEIGKWYYIAAIPKELEKGFTIEFYGSQKTELKNEKPVSIKRAVWGKLVDADEDSIVPFEDANFKAYCVENFDKDGDGDISVAEALAVTRIEVNTDSIESLRGVEFFTNLQSLSAYGSAAMYTCIYGGWIFRGNTSSLPKPAVGTSVATGKLTELNLSTLRKLQVLDISCNNCVTDFTPGICPELRIIRCSLCNISLLDVSNNTALTTLDCLGNQLTTLDVSNNKALTDLYCSGNQLTILDVSNNTALISLNCSDNQLTTLDLRNNIALEYLSCGGNQLITLDVSNNTELINLECGRNQLTSLDLRNNTALIQLDCLINQLATLDVSNNTALNHMYCYVNQLAALDVSHNTALTDLICYDNQLTTLDVRNNTALIQLACSDNQLTTLDVSNNAALTNLNCSDNQLSTLDVSNNIALAGLYCNSNQLTTLDVSNNTALISLNCSDNQLSSLDVSSNTILATLWCSSNPYLTDIWFKTGQTIQSFSYDTNVATIKYK